MSRLTWRNVSAPNFSDANRLLQSAGAGLKGGFSGLSEGVGELRDRQRRDRSNAAIPMLAKVAQEKGVNSAIDEVGQMVRPEDRTEDLNAMIANLRGTVTDYGQTRAQTGSLNASAASTRAGTSRQNEDHNRRIAREDQLAGQAGEILRQQERALGVGSGGNPTSGPMTEGTGGPPMETRELLARTIQAEAGNQGRDGINGVASVIGNRVRSGNYGEGVRGVLMRPGQFSPLNSITGYADGEQGVDIGKVEASEDAYAAADGIMSGNMQDVTGGATHFYNPDVSQPEWGQQKSGGEWNRINDHIFGNPDGAPGSRGDSQVWGPGVGVSQMIPEDNVLPPSVYQGLLETNRASAESTETERRDDQNIAAKENAAVMARQARDRAFSMLQGATPGPGGLDEAVLSVWNNPNITGESQDILTKALKEVHGEMSGVGQNLSGLPSMVEQGLANGNLSPDEAAAISPEQVQRYGDTITDSNGFNGFTEQDITNLDMSKEAPQDLSSALGQWNEDLGGDAENRVLNTDGVAEMLQDLAGETGIPAEKLVPFARQTIGNRNFVSDMMKPTKERIKERLSPFLGADGRISADNYSQAMSRFRSGIRRGEQFTEIEGELEELDAQYQGWLTRPQSETRTKNLQRLLRQRKTLVNRAQALSQQAGDATGFRSASAPGASGSTRGSGNDDQGSRPEPRGITTREGGPRGAAEALQSVESTRTADRQGNIEANQMIREWLETSQGREFISKNPQLIRLIQADPVRFMQEYMSGQDGQ